MKRRVAIFSVVPSPYQRDLFRAMSQREEWELSVFYLEAAAPDSPWPQVPLEPFEHILPGFWLPLGSMRFHINRSLPPLRDFDFIILNTLTTGTAQYLLSIIPRHVPWVFWGEKLRDQTESWKQGTQKLFSYRLDRACGIVGVGSRATEDYHRRFPQVRHFSIPYHCDLASFWQKPADLKIAEEINFIFCGQMIFRKGIDILLAAFKDVMEKGHNANLILVGREAELAQFLNPLPERVKKRIFYEGFQAPEKLPEFFQRSQVFILPSRYEGWGVVVNQALGAGLPLLCSDAVGAGYDLIQQGDNGMRLPVESSSLLAEKMAWLIQHPETIQKWGDVSRSLSYTWTPEKGAEKWSHVIQALTQS